MQKMALIAVMLLSGCTAANDPAPGDDEVDAVAGPAFPDSIEERFMLFAPYIDTACANSMMHGGTYTVMDLGETGNGTTIHASVRMAWTSNHPSNLELGVLIEDDGNDTYEPSGASPVEFSFQIAPSEGRVWGFSPYYQQVVSPQPFVGDAYKPNMANVTVEMLISLEAATLAPTFSVGGRTCY